MSVLSPLSKYVYFVLQASSDLSAPLSLGPPQQALTLGLSYQADYALGVYPKPWATSFHYFPGGSIHTDERYVHMSIVVKSLMSTNGVFYREHIPGWFH
jgi:hypothetical protein